MWVGFVVLLTAGLGVAGEREELGIPAWKSPVMDLAGVIDDGAERSLDGFLEQFGKQTSAQIAVLTVSSLQGHDASLVAVDVAHDWGVGSKGKDNGVLLLVAPADRKYFTSVGYGLEGVLPDSLIGQLQREILVPNFKSGDYAAGITQYVHELATRIAKEAGVELQAPAGYSRRPEVKRRGLGSYVWSILMLLFVISMFTRGRRGGRALAAGMMLGGFGGGFGGGRSSGGGGFSGGFGGGFGGGGAGGSW